MPAETPRHAEGLVGAGMGDAIPVNEDHEGEWALYNRSSFI